MKLIVKPSTKQYQEYITSDGFLLGLKDLSCDFNITHTVDEIKTIRQDYPSKEIFVSLNKTIFDSDLDNLQKALIELAQLNIDGILFYDLAILELTKELNLNLNLVWNQTHMVTNIKTCNYYYSKGVEKALLANEITLEEMLEIKNNTKMKCMALLYGYPVVAHSKRKLLSNYYEFLNKPKTNSLVVKEMVNKQEYLFKEDNTGTSIYYDEVLNGSKPYLELLNNAFDYGILNEDDINHEQFLKVLAEYKKVNNNYQDMTNEDKEKWLTRMEEVIGSNYTGFFYQKTIFKVKKNGKN